MDYMERWHRALNQGAARNRTFVSGPTSALALPASQYRWALIITALGTQVNWLSFGETAVVGQGLLLEVPYEPIILNYHDHGPLVRLPIFVITVAGNDTLGFVESLIGEILP